MTNGALVVVGVGMTFLSHMTTEARGHIEQADRVFLLVASPGLVAWLEELNSNSSLWHVYAEREPGKDTAEEWRQQIDEAIETLLTPVREGAKVCLVLDGHPGVSVPPTHEAVRRARLEGLSARMLPGVSAEDCLFADLGIDPIQHGCLSYDATDFLVRRRPVSPTSALILRQIGPIGELMLMGRYNDRGVRVLTEVLQDTFGDEHEVVVYEAAPYAIGEPDIQRVPLSALPDARITDFSTLYVPPRHEAPLAPDMLARLGLSAERLRY